MLWYNWSLIILGILICIDGIGSMLLPGNTHKFWYDMERWFRADIGLAIVIIGAMI